jgi:hypothetical protein
MLEFGIAMGQSSGISVDLGRTRNGKLLGQVGPGCQFAMYT